MTIEEIQPLVNAYHRKLSDVGLGFKRYLYSQIDWSGRIVGIKGERGVGKTTLILQHIKETFSNPDDAMYVSLDNLWFASHNLVNLVDFLYSHGTVNLFLDEVHKYPGWIQTLKNLYDDYPDLKIVYTGSSMLEIDNSRYDLSRRQSLYTLHCMSFREYLEFEGVLQHEAIGLEEILSGHVAAAMAITSKLKILPYFERYLEHGTYPFYKESPQTYHQRLQAVVETVLESDLPAVENITFETIQKTRRLLMIIAEGLPFIPNVHQLCAALECTRESCLKMLYSMDKAGILHILTSELKNYKKLVNPDKIYLGNTNLSYSLSTNREIGTLRETFFANQVGAMHTLQYPKKGDFFACGKYLFEVGGRRKTFEQIKDEPDSFLAVDETEIGYGNRIPLWLFGFIY